MTKDEFEKGYAERSGVTVKWLHDHNKFGVPCDCGEEGCHGWQMKYDFLDNQFEDYIQEVIPGR